MNPVDKILKATPSRRLGWVGAGHWIAHAKGSPGESSFEICVIRADNKFGMDSYGWFSEENKRLISHNGGPDRTPILEQWLWDRLVAVAEEYAMRLNLGME